jgi:uncharacterized membrane protein
MNGAHLHLVLNHLPIIIPLIGLLILLGGILFKSDIVKRAAYLIFILGAIVTIPAFATGEGAEEVIEGLAGVDEELIETHEEIAETFAILSYMLGGISLVGFWSNLYKKSFSTIISYLTMLICAIALYFAKQTGTTGGEIRHSEIRENTAKQPTLEKD